MCGAYFVVCETRWHQQLTDGFLSVCLDICTFSFLSALKHERVVWALSPRCCNIRVGAYLTPDPRGASRVKDRGSTRTWHLGGGARTPYLQEGFI